MAIKSYRRRGWPKGKASSALPLIALGLGLYVVSKSGKKPAAPKPGDNLLASAPAAEPAP